LVVSDYIPNEELPAVYASVGVLLNDHWQTMRSGDSSRTGCSTHSRADAGDLGTPSGDRRALRRRGVEPIATPAALRALVASTLADPDGARARRGPRARLVRQHHTFDHRAEQLLDALRRHRL